MLLILDGLLMLTRSQAHDHIKQQLKLPEYYGRNLDALYDLLMEVPGGTEIRLVHHMDMLDHLGSYGDILFRTLQEAAEENPNLTFSAQ